MFAIYFDNFQTFISLYLPYRRKDSPLILDEKTGRPLNGNLLDYKMMTMLDTPEIKVDFVELNDPIGPYGNKALGEPPAIPCAPAIRNAVLHATGIAFNENPLTPQKLIDGFRKHGLIAADSR